MSEDRKSNPWHPIFWGVLALGVVLRLYNLAGHAYWYDETVTIAATSFVDWNFSFMSSEEGRTVPLFSVLSAAWIRWVEVWFTDPVTRDFVLRFPCALIGIAIIPAAYRVSLRLFADQRAALIGAALIAISPFHIYYAQEFRPHTMYALLCFIAAYNCYLALEHGQRKHWIGVVVFGTLAFYAYYFSAVFLVSVNVYAALMFKRYRNRIVPWTLSQLAIIALIVPAFLMALRQWGYFSTAEEHWFPMPGLKHIFLILKVYVAGYSPSAWIYYILLLATILFVVIAVAARRKTPIPIAFLLAMAFIPVIFQIAAWNTQDFAFFTYRIQLPFSIPVFILMGLGIASIKPRALSAAVLAVFTLLTAPTILDVYQQDMHPVWNHRIGARYKVDTRSAANFIAKNWKEGDYIAHVSSQTTSPFKHRYFVDAKQNVVGFTDEERQGLLASADAEELWDYLGFIPRRIEDIAADSKRVWFVSTWWEPFQPEPIPFEIRAWFDAHYRRVAQYNFDGIHLYLFDTQSTSVNRKPVITNGVDSVPISSENGLAILRKQLEPRLSGFRPLIWMQSNGGKVEVKKTTTESITTRCQVYQVLKQFPAIAMNRVDGSDVWRVTSHYHGLQTMSARVNPGEESKVSASIRWWRRQSKDEQVTLFVRANVVEDDRADAVVSVFHEGRQVLSEPLDTSASTSGSQGWKWIEIGRFDMPNDEVAIEVLATNHNSESRRYLDIERVAIVLDEDLPQFLEPTVYDFEIERKSWREIDAEVYETPARIVASGVRGSPVRNTTMFEAEDSLGFRYLLYRN